MILSIKAITAKKGKWKIGLVIALIFVGGIIGVYSFDQNAGENLFSTEKGDFKIEIKTQGELEALEGVEVLGPQEARKYRVKNFTIEKLVPEGTVVKKGDFIASIDQSDMFEKLEERRLDLEQYQAQFEQVQLDTSLILREERDNIKNLEFTVQEQELILEQSQFEPPAIVERNRQRLETAKRELFQGRERYAMKTLQEAARMREISSKYTEHKEKVQEMEAILEEFDIVAPEDGMVIYRKYKRKKVVEGTQISSWKPVIVKLPNLKSIHSITQVNEVDIRKIEKGMQVEITMDAMPEKKYKGTIAQIGNVGQSRSNSDSKVFEVVIQFDEFDPLLRPTMTTGHKILADHKEDVLQVPMRAIHVENDSINFVYTANGKKQEVMLGEDNSENVIIEKGLAEGEKIHLTKPDWENNQLVELLEELDGKRNPQEIPEPLADSFND
ncbi:efflux RND transporter periplasmic adaptor subunit [Pleomorphovibrio marinus]|uniref:efflux RND transporter periplasmic adaptor subunit n=1 Tax=Pleomorphovibrio marinus TaxID=2164132 RepID=UPI000E0A6B2C|nr:efflux RND transporter periplasmic adaptor subunit [Pleomorphovibrio marinus]